MQPPLILDRGGIEYKDTPQLERHQKITLANTVDDLIEYLELDKYRYIAFYGTTTVSGPMQVSGDVNDGVLNILDANSSVQQSCGPSSYMPCEVLKVWLLDAFKTHNAIERTLGSQSSILILSFPYVTLRYSSDDKFYITTSSMGGHRIRIFYIK